METRVAVPVSTNDFIELIDFLRSEGIDRDPVLAVSDAIHYWIESLGWKKDDLVRESLPTKSQGYTWKYKDDSIFLPHETQIRMRFKGSYHYAQVVNDDIMYQGNSVSPALFANTIAKSDEKLGSRNAWKYLWIKRPWDNEWILADECRKAAKQALEELGI